MGKGRRHCWFSVSIGYSKTCYLHSFIDSGSVFKSGWIDCPPEWHQPDLASEFDILRCIKAISNKVLESARMDGTIRSSLEAELTLTSSSQYLSDLLSRHLHDSSGNCTGSQHKQVEFSLADILIVSNVNLIAAGEEIAHSEGSHDCVSEAVNCDGEMVEVKALVMPASTSGKHKCPRCWKWTSQLEQTLCSRCELVMGG